MRSIADLWRRGQEGWPRRFPVVQFPNPPLMVAFAGWGLATRAEGTAREVGRATFAAGLVVWAVEELMAGANWLRRGLGVGALAWLVVRGAREQL